MKLILFLLLSISAWANIGIVMVAKGEVKIKRVAYVVLLDAKSGMKLLKSDEVFTQAKSRAQIILNDDTIITVGAKSSMTFEDFVLDGNKSKVDMRANRGFFRSVTGKIGKLAPERFKVKTASATIGIRGTDFSGNIVGKKAILKCYSGVITVAHKPPPPSKPSVDAVNAEPDTVQKIVEPEMIIEVVEAGMMVTLISQESQVIDTGIVIKEDEIDEKEEVELDEEVEVVNYNKRSIIDIIDTESQVGSFDITDEDMFDITKMAEDIAPY